ncbi:MAG: outer membrane beta-barrel protein [Acidobacteriota bacterium]
MDRLASQHVLPAAAAALAVALLFSAPAAAQETYTFTAGVLGGIGGSTDAEPGDGLDNGSFQLDLGVVFQPQNHLVARIGRLGLGGSDRFADLVDADLTYATIGGEYRYRHSYYDSGLYLALGAYRLEGDLPAGGEEDETAVGLALGVTGEFPINRWLGVQLEVSGHYADFDRAQVFAMGHAGLVVHF